ncbi:MAG: substrate-binding domain-containing protein [Peptococcaceae bacterium]|nr:substrate-binding domain-containing protein [Peptococcaceae bacterium]
MQANRKQESRQQAPAERVQIMLSSTIGPIDAGIVDVLEREFEKKTGIVVRHIGAGTGETLKIAKGGSVDLVMVHARALEEQFVAEGYGTRRYDLMYNDFVIMGPPADPAKIRGEKSAAEALKKISQAEARFVSRGDMSGTHVKELEVWEKAGIKPAGPWYRVYEKGAEGNAKTLKYADEQQAYTIIDRATYLTMKKDLKLEVLVEKDELLLNYITLIPVNPQKFPSVKYAEAMKFVEWLTSVEGQTIIRDFGKDKYGSPLFFPNSPAGKELK